MDMDPIELAALRERIRAELASDLGRKGGHARNKALTKKQLSKIGRKAARARWANHKKVKR